jgi:Leucine-rich repeat (LRR) protein
MKKQATTWHSLAALVVLAACGPGCFACDGADGKSAPKPLPAATSRAWEGVGAQVGWMKIVHPQRVAFEVLRAGIRPGFAGFYGHWEPWREKGEAGTIPAFRLGPAIRLGRMKAGVLTKLPDPGVPFGVDCQRDLRNGATLKELAGPKNLRVLNIGQMRQEDLKELSALKHLKGLYLSLSFGLSEARLKDIAVMRDLQTLDLSHSDVTDKGLKGLAALKNLQALHLGATRVTDKGLKGLAEMKSLQQLDLAGTDVTDAGLKELAGLDLQWMKLHGTNTTEAGLKHLTGLKSLRSLEVGDTQVTADGIAALQRALPACKTQH